MPSDRLAWLDVTSAAPRPSRGGRNRKTQNSPVDAPHQLPYHWIGRELRHGSALSGGRLMIPQSSSLRWLAVAVYSAALLGALMVPHAHHPGGDCCSQGLCPLEHDHAIGKRAETSACRHHHHPATARHTCRHHQHSPAAPKPTKPAPTPSSPPAAPFDAECVLCRFLAQPVQLASPPLLLIGEALTPTLPDAVAILAEPAALSTPPVRGPPLG